MTNKKKVLFLITKATWGGAQRYVYDLAAHLPREQFEPIVAHGESGRLAKMLSEARIQTYGLSALQRDVAFFSDIASFFGILKCIRAMKPDVIHLNSSKAAALGALAARVLGVPKIIFTVHGWPFKEGRNEFTRVLIYLVSWFTAFLSDAVIVVSKSDEAQGRKMRWVGKKIHYVPIGIEMPHFIARDEALEAFGLKKASVPRIVTIAELIENKGLRYGIEAISVLKSANINAQYTIIGTGELRRRLEDFAMETNVTEHVTFAGFVDDAARYLKAFDVFLLPSIKEGMPYVLPEAAAAGLPIVTTTVVNPAFVDSYSRIRAVPPADPEALAAALMETMREMSEGELFPPQNHFTLSDMTEKTIALYN
ncbi:glycosyltransferase [Candidatus Kaiserbacteria bacterium]|nr:glycosyltransferase [Candidatus Kaiserbacteria bacterium]